MTNRPPSPKAKTRSTSALGRITRLLRRTALIAAVAVAPLIALPTPVAAANNTAGCTYISGTNGTELYFTVGNCDNAFEGTIYLVYPDGSTTTFVEYGEFWQFYTGSPYLMTTSVKITQTGTYTLKLDGMGVDAALQPVEVHWSKSWNLTAPRGSTPAPSTPAPSTPQPVATPKPDATPKPVVAPTPEATPATTDDTALVTETEPSAEPSMTTDDQIAVMTVDETRQTVSTAMTAVGDGVQSLITTIAAAAAGVLALGTLLVVAVVRRRRR
jgi:hypothetical protein